EAVRDVDRAFRAALLEGESVILNLDVEVLAEQLGEPLSQGCRFLELILEDELTEFAGRAAAQANEALPVRSEKLLIDARVIVVAVEKRRGRHLDEVLEADSVLRQQREVVSGFASTPGLAFRACAGSYIRLVAKDGVEPSGFAFLVELDGPVKI